MRKFQANGKRLFFSGDKQSHQRCLERFSRFFERFFPLAFHLKDEAVADSLVCDEQTIGSARAEETGFNSLCEEGSNQIPVLVQ